MVSLFALLFSLFLVLLVFGLINPRWVIFQGAKTRRKAVLIYGMSAAISLVLFGCNFSGSTQSTNDPPTTQPQVAETSKTESTTSMNSPTLTTESQSPTQPVVHPSKAVQKPHPTAVARSPEVKPVHPKSQRSVQETESQKFTPKPSPKIVAQSPEQPKEKTASDIPSRSPRKGSCGCPYDTDSADHICGKRSAFSRPSGEHPVCYRQ